MNLRMQMTLDILEAAKAAGEGAVAGIVVGYTAGPAISHSWGVRRSDSRYRNRTAQRPTAARSNNAALKQAAAESVSAAPPKPASGTKRTWDSPPVLGFE
jgi:hypothetical protein